jgi:protein gp37
VSRSTIEWTDDVWNPVRGCSRISRGCERCYAERQAARFGREGQPWHGFVGTKFQTGRGWQPTWTGRVELIEEKLAEPLAWGRPRRVFVNSMSDLFHEALPDEALDRVLAVVARCPQHTFQVLTKRPERARTYLSSRSEKPGAKKLAVAIAREFSGYQTSRTQDVIESLARGSCDALPLPNLWVGTSVEDQASADDRIPHLLETPAAVRFVSAEPLLGPVNLRAIPIPGLPSVAVRDALRREGITPREHATALDWVIVGGESGPGARPCKVAWIRALVGQCRTARVPVFVKQLGAVPFDDQDESTWPHGWAPHVECVLGRPAPARETYRLRSPKGGDPSEWPEDLRVREFPAASALRVGGAR